MLQNSQLGGRLSEEPKGSLSGEFRIVFGPKNNGRWGLGTMAFHRSKADSGSYLPFANIQPPKKSERIFLPPGRAHQNHQESGRRAGMLFVEDGPGFSLDLQ